MNTDPTDEPWSWPRVRAELLPLLDRLSGDDALDILKRLIVAEQPEHYVVPMLAGMIKGNAARREDRVARCCARCGAPLHPLHGWHIVRDDAGTIEVCTTCRRAGDETVATARGF